MSKPEPTGAKSLEEILASIRKSLAEEAPERPSAPAAGPARATQTAAQADAKPVKAATAPDAGAGANGAGFSNRLAAALNGPSGATAGDEDLSDLLSNEPTKRAPVAPASPAKPAETPANGKDPLWFLSRLSGAAGGGSGAAARARDAAKGEPSLPTAPVEEVRLSRPEELRATLPPLFGSGEATAASVPAAEAPFLTAKAGETSQLRTEPRMPPWPADKAKTVPAPAEPREAPAAVPPPREPAAPSESLSSLPTEPAFTPDPPPLGPTLSVEPALAPPAFEPAPAEEAQAMPGPIGMPPAPLPTRALEQVVAELLEPVIQQWLQGNLPRLIEKVVREEAAKAVAAARDAKKV